MFDKEKINKIYPEAIMYEPMKIHASTDTQLQSACSSGKYFGQLKKDGYWYQFEKHFYHSYLFSRATSKTTGLLTEKSDNVPHIINALQSLPPKTILIGEIYYPGGSSKNVTEIMGCLPEKAIKRQKEEKGLIHYYIHDILMYNDVDFIKGRVGNELRYKILQKIFYLHNLDKYDFLELAESWDDDLYARIEIALRHGEEGMVLKRKDALYEPGKRPDSNLKAKKTTTFDCIIIGFEAPTYQYYGKDIENWQYWVDAKDDFCLPIGLHYGEQDIIPVTKPYYMHWIHSRIIVGAYNENGEMINIGTIHSGISDNLKKDMTYHPDNYINHVCEIQAMEVDKKEKTLRHGFLLRVREDKDPKECTINSIFNF